MKKRTGNLRLRRPEGTAAVRHMCMDKEKVSKYFYALHELLEKRQLLDKPYGWNESPASTCTTICRCRKGTRYLQSRTSGNKETITIIACINVAGNKIPPHIIAKGKTERSLHGFDLNSAPSGALFRTVFKPLKDAYGDECQRLMNEYPGVVVSKLNFCGLLSRAWNRALTADNIRSGFKVCGIYPINPDQIPSEAYIPNLLYRVQKDDCQSPPSTGGTCGGHGSTG